MRPNVKLNTILLTAILLLFSIFMGAYRIELSSATQKAYQTKRELYVAQYSKEFGIDPALLAAIIKHESKLFARAERNDRARLEGVPWVESIVNQYALDREDPETWHSMGYSQILYLTVVDMGYLTWAKERGLSCRPSDLLDIQTNIYWACEYIKQSLMNRYTDPRYIAAGYNAGSARKDATGKYRNQEYVDSVMVHYLEYGGHL